MKILRNLAILALVLSSTTLFSQGITASGQVGWAMPQGNLFKADGEDLSNGGLSFDFDVLYHPEKFDYKLGLGLSYNTSILFGQSSGFDVGIFGLSLYAAKAHYRFSERTVKPYAALSLGLSQFSTPIITDEDGQEISVGGNDFSFGLRPEVGIELGGFLIAAGYIVPMKYEPSEMSAGVLQISIGYRYASF